MKKAQIALSDSAVADILDQADWYEGQSDCKLAMRWEKAVDSTQCEVGRMCSPGKQPHGCVPVSAPSEEAFLVARTVEICSAHQ